MRLPVLCAFVLLCACALRAEDRDTATALLGSAEKSYKGGDFATAKSMCERALGADGTFPAAHFLMGQVLEALNQPRDAIKTYQCAAEFAKKENNTALSNKALEAAKKLGPGLLEIAQADQKLADKMLALGDRALADEQLDTAKASFAAVVALTPTNEKAREKLAQTERAIAARGDPVKARIAAATLSEVWYHIGNKKQDEAVKLANDLTARFGNTPAGQEAAQLLATNFDVSKDIHGQLASVKKELVEKQKKLAARPPTPPPSSTGPTVSKPVSVVRPAGPHVDVEAVEKTAAEEARKLPNDRLVAVFQEHVTKGKEFYSKATPGTEGNQKNLALALEQFIHSEAVYLRLEEQKLLTAQLEEDEKQASMLRYACMKMTILTQ
jgi:Tfp pilus assembly protein PilF